MKNGPVWIGAWVYRSIGPMIEFHVHSDEGFGADLNDEPITDQDVYFWPGQTFRFALHLVWICCYAALFRLRLILRDYGWKF